MLKTKSVYSDTTEGDGLRILATRSHGHGLTKTKYDVWMANLGPSESLRDALQNEKISWSEFKVRYRAEMLTDRKLDKGNELHKNRGQLFTLRLLKHLAAHQNVTLLCHCAEDEPECHRHLLMAIIESGKV
jgi:uncharacterized protein YeaO (DUF488 family)